MSRIRTSAALALALTFALAPTVSEASHSWTIPGTVRVGFVVEPTTLNPLLGTSIPDADIACLAYDGLIRVDDHGQPVPDLALAVPSRANGGISPDGTTLTYHLAPNARWHDGAPVTSHDVLFTWRALMNPANNVSNREGFDKISSIDTPDPHTVRIHYRRPYAPGIFLFEASIQGAILPSHLLERLPNLNKVPFNTQPVGSGPYVFKRWDHGSKLVFDANPAYFRGAPRIGHIVISIVPDTNTQLSQIRTHEIDLTADLDPSEVATARATEGTTVGVVSGNGFRHLSFNTRRPGVDDPRVRRALATAVDTKAIYTKVYFSLGLQAPADQNPATSWADPAAKYYPYDPALAGRELDAAGWRRGPDGIRIKNGRRLELELVTVAGARANESIEVIVQAAWHALGVDVTIKNFPGTTLFAPYEEGGIVNTGKFDVALFSLYRNIDPNDTAIIGPHNLPPAGRNTSFYVNDEIGRLQEQGVETFDSARRHQIYNAIQRIIVRDVPIYTLLWVPVIVTYNDDIRGVRPGPGDLTFWNVADWRN
jgi:peptide/nickel transport system substrate-binding protein